MPAKVELTPALPGLSPVGGKPVIARFDGGHLSSDGGLLVLREVEQRLGVAGRLVACVNGGQKARKSGVGLKVGTNLAVASAAFRRSTIKG